MGYAKTRSKRVAIVINCVISHNAVLAGDVAKSYLIMSNKNQKSRSLSVSRPELTDVFSYPQYTLRGISTWDEVAILGKQNLDALVKSARSHEKELTSRIERLYEKVNLLRDKSGKDFQKLAKEFENPKDIEVGTVKDGWSNDPEPIDAKSRGRESGATTFNMCGWCKHTGGGSCRYSYYISTSCNLATDSPETKFNTPCLLQAKTAPEIQHYVDDFETQISNTKAKREKVRAGIKHLQSLKKTSTDKPYLMSLRPHDHFNVGDEVVVNITKWDTTIVEGNWVDAIVIFGYRHHDGCISYQTLFPIHTGDYLEGRGGGAGMSRPEVIHKKDFFALRDANKSDVEFFNVWMNNVDSLKDFSINNFQDDIKEGMMAVPNKDWTPPAEDDSVMTVKKAMNILCMLVEPKKGEEARIDSWAKMQLQFIHPDKMGKRNETAQTYAERQTKLVISARDLLKERIK